MRRASTVALATLVALTLVGTGLMVARARPPVLVPAAPASFDPLVQYADFGWLPDGFPGRMVQTQPDYQRLGTGLSGNPGAAGDDPTVELTVVTAGHHIWADELGAFPTDGGRVTSPAEPVNGRPARWGQSFGRIALLWEYAVGAWAQVEVSGVDDPNGTARRIAASARFGVNAPITMPMALPDLPGGLRPGTASRVTGTGRLGRQHLLCPSGRPSSDRCRQPAAVRGGPPRW